MKGEARGDRDLSSRRCRGSWWYGEWQLETIGSWGPSSSLKRPYQGHVKAHVKFHHRWRVAANGDDLPEYHTYEREFLATPNGIAKAMAWIMAVMKRGPDRVTGKY